MLDLGTGTGPPVRPARRSRTAPVAVAALLAGAGLGWAASAATGDAAPATVSGDRLVLVATSGTIGDRLATFDREGVLLVTLVNAGPDRVAVRRLTVDAAAQDVAAALAPGGTVEVRLPVRITCDPQHPLTGAAPPVVVLTGAGPDGVIRDVRPRLDAERAWGDLRAECRRQEIGDAQTGDGTVT